ncbi:hypothetical protein GGR02_002891 [Anoxybacillus voinovskiensis]|uniref:Uncharacterized protein n=1 Tax=Anoxybacteroides voinovskiense TaxID=230470 RepID=A0A840DQ05_9BACL|nr:hypothetical protein [Anoxybacillus voinovskiensis]MBB4075090.1 hypothetical protein [Anoxybacillus voinovskiensis]GGJ76739.1 hypothetical protein GCM10008982_27570 [Anoxybacillus voinovskiensis]
MKVNEQMKTEKNEKEVIELEQMHDMEEDDHEYEMQTDDEGSDQEIACQQDENEDVAGMVGLEGFKPANALHEQRAPKTGAGALSIVFTPRNGKRFVIARHVIENLGNPETVQVAYSDHAIAIAEYIGEEFTNYVLKASGSKRVIYSAHLVELLIECCELDFSNRTTITFSDVSYQTHNGKKVAIISMK